MKCDVPGPLFISFEGGEGCGKSTQASLLHNRLWGRDIPATIIHEPGSTPLGDHLREYLVKKPRLSKKAELLLFEAARAEVVVTEILPSLDQGLSVVADRFEASTIAYQGWGRKIDLSIIEGLNSFATGDLYPDLTFLLDLDPEKGLQRIGKPQLSFAFDEEDDPGTGRLDEADARRFEDQPLAFHKRIRRGFLAQAKANPERWITIDAELTVEAISEAVWKHVTDRLGISDYGH